MASASFTHRYFINADVNKIYSYMSDPNSYIGLSPLVTAVNNIQRLPESDVPTIQYEAVETFHFLGFIRYPNHIKVRLLLTKPNVQLVHQVESIPNVRVRFTFDFQPEGSGTWINESVVVTMPLPLKGYVVSQAKSVQQSRAQILKTRMEVG